MYFRGGRISIRWRFARLFRGPNIVSANATGASAFTVFRESLGCYLRIVLLSDGETVHNAFPDEGFAP